MPIRSQISDPGFPTNAVPGLLPLQKVLLARIHPILRLAKSTIGDQVTGTGSASSKYCQEGHNKGSGVEHFALVIRCHRPFYGPTVFWEVTTDIKESQNWLNNMVGSS